MMFSYIQNTGRFVMQMNHIYSIYVWQTDLVIIGENFSFCQYFYFWQLPRILLHSELRNQTINEVKVNYENSSVQFSSVTQSCSTLCDPMNCNAPGLPVHHKLLEFTQTHAHRVSEAIQPSHSLSSPSLPVPNPSKHQGLFH